MQVLEGDVTHKEGSRSMHLGDFALASFCQIDCMRSDASTYVNQQTFFGTQKAAVFANPVQHYNYTIKHTYNCLCYFPLEKKKKRKGDF